MFCSQCGHRLETGVDVCPNCQTAVGEPVLEKKSAFPGGAGKDTMKPIGMFAALFDFSFESFITLKIIKFLYIICVGMTGLLTLGIIITGFGIDSGTGVLFLLIVGPLFFLLSLIYSRVLLELIAVLFCIQAYTAELVEQGRRKGA